MPKNKALDRYKWREKHRRQYTFTKTKMVVGFFISVSTSILLGSYLDKYGKVALKQSSTVISSIAQEYFYPRK